MPSQKEDKASKTPPKNGPTACMSFLKRACGCEYACGQIQKFNTSQLDFWNGSALWYFHHSDISGFYFLSNCTAWCVLRGFHENDESLISTMLQLWGNMGMHFEPVHSWVDWNNRNRKQKQRARVKMAIQNSTVFKIPACYENESFQLKSLIPSMFQILLHIHITLKQSVVPKFPKQWYLLYSTYSNHNLCWHHMLVGSDNL